jgi:hypothetical protein
MFRAVVGVTIKKCSFVFRLQKKGNPAVGIDSKYIFYCK